jgi:hypothetical protein
MVSIGGNMGLLALYCLGYGAFCTWYYINEKPDSITITGKIVIPIISLFWPVICGLVLIGWIKGKLDK